MINNALDSIRENGQKRTFNIVIIEWDGKGADRRWYRRLNVLAGNVRGNDPNHELSIIERRADKGLIIQEGCILTPSYSLAKTLAVMAREEFGAAHVELGTAELSYHFGAETRDLQILGRIEKTLGKRGRPLPPERYVVTCHEEMASYEMETDQPIQCPSCHGFRIHTRNGFLTTRTDDGRNIFHLWLGCRFHYLGHWENSPIRYEGATDTGDIYTQYPAARSLDDLSEPAQAHLSAVLNSPIAKIIEGMDRKLAIDIIDAIYVARASLSKSERGAARLEAITLFFKLGGDPSSIEMMESATTADFLDTALLLGPETAVQLQMRYGSTD